MLTRLLFWTSVVVSAVLFTTVLGAPWLVDDPPHEAPYLFALFALDSSVRRATLACAAALLVTAMVFFRKSGEEDSAGPPNKSARRVRARRTIGA